MFFRPNKKIKPFFTKGFTLVEVLVSVVIFTILLAIVVYALFSISRSERHVRALRNIETSAVVLMERITREIKNASSVDVANSVFLSDSGKLVLITPNDSGGSKTLEFFLSNGVLRLKENGVDTGQITLSADRSNIARLFFALISINNIQGVKIETTIESGTGEYEKTKNFYNTAMVRSTY